MENQITVKISAPQADGFDRVVTGDVEDRIPEHKRLVTVDENSVTIELSQE